MADVLWLLLVGGLFAAFGLYVWASGSAVTASEYVGLVVALGLFAYFLAAMLCPERF